MFILIYDLGFLIDLQMERTQSTFTLHNLNNVLFSAHLWERIERHKHWRVTPDHQSISLSSQECSPKVILF